MKPSMKSGKSEFRTYLSKFVLPVSLGMITGLLCELLSKAFLGPAAITLGGTLLATATATRILTAIASRN